MDLIEKLNILMKTKKIRNISQLSREADIPYTTLKSIFDGNTNDVRLSTSRKLSAFFHITLDDLLDDDIIIEGNDKIDFEGLNENDMQDVKKYVEFLKYKKREETNN